MNQEKNLPTLQFETFFSNLRKSSYQPEDPVSGFSEVLR
jgi:hypothetical protein